MDDNGVGVIEAPPSSFLGWAIAAMVLCFLPFGIVSAIYAVRSQTALDGGDVGLALRLRLNARRWAIAALVVGLILDLIALTFLLLLGAFGG